MSPGQGWGCPLLGFEMTLVEAGGWDGRWKRCLRRGLYQNSDLPFTDRETVHMLVRHSFEIRTQGFLAVWSRKIYRCGGAQGRS